MNSSETLTTMFQENHGNPIEFDGHLIHWTYWMPIESGDILHVRFLSHRPSAYEGIVVNFGDGLGRNEDTQTQAKGFQFWAGFAPTHVPVRVVNVKPGSRAMIYNIWSYSWNGPMLYRLNNAAMDVEVIGPDDVVLRCNDGLNLDPPTFQDLVVQITRERQGGGGE